MDALQVTSLARARQHQSKRAKHQVVSQSRSMPPPASSARTAFPVSQSVAAAGAATSLDGRRAGLGLGSHWRLVSPGSYLGGHPGVSSGAPQQAPHPPPSMPAPSSPPGSQRPEIPPNHNGRGPLALAPCALSVSSLRPPVGQWHAALSAFKRAARS
ncbi:hypothetical protein ACCO45_000257 [Purpureocillium lilacinum]|uniref:Uncharacterized protein n=1 Tax=Purpureocillium lilacinum TaxID=33203 RepID=A0ACC4E4J7_PURLI